MSTVAQPQLVHDVADAMNTAIDVEALRARALHTISEIEALPHIDVKARKRFANAKRQLLDAGNHLDGRT